MHHIYVHCVADAKATSMYKKFMINQTIFSNVNDALDPANSARNQLSDVKRWPGDVYMNCTNMQHQWLMDNELEQIIAYSHALG